MRHKALVLFSGGLDSILTVRLLKELGLDVEAVNFSTAFGVCSNKTGKDAISDAAARLGVKLHRIDVSKDFFKMIKSPKHGYGRNMNPCVDCKIFMCEKAGELMKKIGAAFAATGEVLGQRPMSQHRPSLKMIEKESGLEGYLLRPLSAKLLDETIPEKEGIVDRQKLLDFNGRSRKPQIALAKEYGIDFYPTPAGGCLLTDPQFVARLKDAMKYSDVTIDDIRILKLGRHFRLNGDCKFIVGRNEKENEEIASFGELKAVRLEPKDVPGPMGLIFGRAGGSEVNKCASIISRYCNKAKTDCVPVHVSGLPDFPKFGIWAKKIDESELKGMLI